MLNKEKLIEMGISEENADKIISEINDDYRPAFKFNNRGDEIERLKKQLDEKEKTIEKRDKQLDNIKEDIKDNEELQQTIEKMKEQNQKEVEALKKRNEEILFNVSLEKELKNKYKAKNPKAVLALIDKGKIKKDGDEFLNLKNQVEKVQETDDYLFNLDDDENKKGNNLKGRKVELKNNKKIEVDSNPFKDGNINLTKQTKLVEENPALAKKLINDAGLDPSIYGF